MTTPDYQPLGQPNPFKTGVVDAVMRRPSKSPWTDYPRQLAYVKGYLHGKELLTKQQEN